MSQLILIPASHPDTRRNFERTVQTPVSLQTLRQHLGQVALAPLTLHFAERPVPTWGTKPDPREHLVSAWSRIQPGDLMLFVGHDGVFASAGIVSTTRNRTLAQALWGADVNQKTWECLEFLDAVQPESIPYATFLHAIGYKPNAVLQQFTVLSGEQSAQAMAELDLGDSAGIEDGQSPTSEAEYFELADDPSLDITGPLDETQLHKVRLEQRFFRTYLFGTSRLGTCGMCGREYPVDLLVAAHIKPRARCTDTERRDYKHVVMPMCKFGCDELYERGYIAVDESGNICGVLGTRSSEALSVYVGAITGRHCAYWSPTTEPYFAWHREHHTFLSQTAVSK